MERNNTDMRVDVRVRLEKTADRVTHYTLRRTREAQGKVWIDTTFDDCKLQSVLVYSGDLETAQALYDGRLLLTVDSTLTLVGT